MSKLPDQATVARNGAGNLPLRKQAIVAGNDGASPHDMHRNVLEWRLDEDRAGAARIRWWTRAAAR